MRWRHAGYWLAHVFLLAYVGVLLGSFWIELVVGELPCPLCILQRMAMLLCGLGPLWIITQARRGTLDLRGYVSGYALSIISALVGAAISTRQILLHIQPGDPGFGSAVLGLHLYTWALITFVIVIAFCGLMLLFASETLPAVPAVPAGGFATLVNRVTAWLFVLLIVGNLVAVFVEAGFNWTLPDNPDRWELLHQLGIR